MAEQEIGRAARAAVTLVVTALVVLGVAACQPAPVPPRPPTPRPPTTTTTTTAPASGPAVLEITYRDGPSLRPLTYTYTVRCGPGAAASITPAVGPLDARKACATVEAERTLLVDGPPRGRFCGQAIYGPETARVVGHIDDDPVDQTFRRGNTCLEGDWRRVGDLVLRPAVIHHIG